MDRRPANPDFQLASGCLADQLVGQSTAHVCGLGHLAKPENIKAALAAIWRMIPEAKGELGERRHSGARTGDRRGTRLIALPFRSEGLAVKAVRPARTWIG